jgi:hypothetical protein
MSQRAEPAADRREWDNNGTHPGNAREQKCYQASSVARGLLRGATQPLEGDALSELASALDPMPARLRIDVFVRAVP